MLGVHEWLPLAAFMMVLLQAFESAKISSKWLVMLYCMTPLAIALIADQIIVEYSILQVHKVVLQFGKPLAGLVLLEALLITFGRVKVPLVTVSGFLALLYLQMSFYQAGWFDWPFTVLALTFGGGCSLIMFLPRLMPQNSTIVVRMLCCWLFLIVAAAYASVPVYTDNQSSGLVTELTDAARSIGVLLFLAAAGYLSLLITNNPNKKGVGT